MTISPRAKGGINDISESGCITGAAVLGLFWTGEIIRYERVMSDGYFSFNCFSLFPPAGRFSRYPVFFVVILFYTFFMAKKIVDI